jgi:guanylate kinase
MFSGDLKSKDILVLIGPSGVGKSFLAKKLEEEYPFKLVLSTTTRPMRDGEVQNVDMHFVTEAEYFDYQQKSDFFSDFDLFGSKYGYLRSSVQSIRDEGLIPVAIVYTTIVPYFYKEFPGNVFSIFLYPKSLDLLETRMKNRGENDASITKRLESCEKETKDYEEILSDIVNECVEISSDSDVMKAISVIQKKYGLEA